MIRVLALVLLVVASGARANCRQALALGLDVSGSVDAQEYRLQLDGLALALGDADVTTALLDPTGGTVQIAVYEWSAPARQRVILPWTEVVDLAVLTQLRGQLAGTQRVDLGPSTGLGNAMQFGFSLLEARSECWTRTLDISGDGKGNTGRRPQDITDVPDGVTVNGLVIGVDDSNSAATRDLQVGELTAYYNAYVIRGSGAFVETALGFEDYADAMRRKLLRELKTFAIGQLESSPQ